MPSDQECYSESGAANPNAAAQRFIAAARPMNPSTVPPVATLVEQRRKRIDRCQRFECDRCVGQRGLAEEKRFSIVRSQHRHRSPVLNHHKLLTAFDPRELSTQARLERGYHAAMIGGFHEHR